VAVDHLWVDDHAELVAVDDPVGAAAGVVAAAVVVHRGDVLGGALPVADAQLHGVLPGPCFGGNVAAGPLLLDQVAEGHHLGMGHDDLVAAAIERVARLDDDELVAAVGVGVLVDVQTADDAGPVQVAVMAAVLAEEVRLLVGEVALEQQLAGEVRVAGELGGPAARAFVPSGMCAGTGHVGLRIVSRVRSGWTSSRGGPTWSGRRRRPRFGR
jgi:hypothetical protein